MRGVRQVEVQFACGMRRRVPGAYLEFAERLVLPQFAHLPVWPARLLNVPDCDTAVSA